MFLCNELQTLKACENVDEKQKISFLLLDGILTSTSRNSRKLLLIVVQHLLFSQTEKWAHFPSITFWWYTLTNSTLNYVFFTYDNKQSRKMNC